MINVTSAPAVCAVEIGGILTRLCHVVDNEDKGIRVYLMSALNYEYNGRNIPIREEHISAYPNENSGKVHIHHTYQFSDAELKTIDNSLVATNASGDFSANITTRIVYKRDHRIPYIPKDKHGSRIELPRYSDDDCTLVLSYVFFTVEHPIPDLLNFGIAHKIFCGKKMNFALYYTYLNIGSYYKGHTIFFSTSTARINGGNTIHLGGGELPSFPRETLSESVIFQLNSCISTYISRFAQDAGVSFSEFQDLKSHLINTDRPLDDLVSQGIAEFNTLDGLAYFQK